MGICQQCVHFRRARPASQLLSQEAGTTDAAISNALVKIQEDESQQRTYESQLKTKKAIAEDERWDVQPRMTEYCGLREAEGMFMIAEVKNFGGRCQDFAAGRPEKRRCAECVHRVQPQGSETDLGMLGMYGKMAGLNIAGGVKSQTPDNLQSNYMQGIGPRKAFEVTAAYQSQGHLSEEPKYLAYCQQFSAEEDYVLCVLQNPHQTCAEWMPAGGASVPQSAAVQTAAVEAAAQAPAAMPAAAAVPAAVASAAPAPAVPQASAAPPPVAAPPVAAPPLPPAPPAPPQPETVTLENHVFADCGGYRFFLDNSQLTVFPPGADKLPEKQAIEAQRHFEAQAFPMRQWMTLTDRDGTQMPISIFNEWGSLKVQVGPPPEGATRGLQPIVANPKTFEVTDQLRHTHPNGLFHFQLDNAFFWLNGPFGIQLNVPVGALPEGQWVMLQDQRQQQLPIKVCRSMGRLFVEWVE